MWWFLALTLFSPVAFPQSVSTTIGVGNSPVAAVANPVTGNIYVVNSASDSVSVINSATNTLTATVNTGTTPVAAAVNPLTNMIYVANSGSNNITVINGATNATSTVTDPNAIGPSAVAIDSLTNRVYVANGGSNNVTVIDGNGNTVAATVGVGTNPAAVAVNPATNRIFVANRGSGNVSVINGANNTVVATVTTGTNPASLSVNTATNTMYVANNGSGNITAINGATNTVEATITVGNNPIAVAVNPVTDTVYIANNGSGNVTVVNGANNTVTTTVNAGTGPVAVATDPTTNQIYVANGGSNNVTVINGVTNTPTTVADPNATAPAAIAVNPVSNSVYVANSGSANVSVIDADIDVVATTVSTPSNPIAVALNSVTDTIYVANNANATVSVINGATNQVVATVNVGTSPTAIAVNTATNIIYVANGGSNTLSVIDGANNSVVATVSTGTDPVAVAVNPVTNSIYVANNGSGNVTVIDGANNLVTSTVSVGTGPVAIASNPATGIVYVANGGSDNVTAFDPVVSSNVTITDLAASHPVALAVDSLTNRIFVANSYSDNVSVINGATATVAASINVGDTPTALTLNPVSNRVYVANTGSNTVSVIDGNLLSVIATVNVGTSPSAVSANPTSNRIYVANNGNASTDLGSVTIIDGTTNATITASDSNANQPYALAANPFTDELYVANNLSSNTSVFTAEQVQSNPITVAISPLAGNTTSNETPTFNFTGTNGFGTWPLDELLFQTDTWQGAWTPATPGLPGQFSGKTSTLLPGFHTIYAYATEGEAATSTVTASQSSPLIGTIAAYGFLVATPLADVAPPSLSFGNQQVGTQSPPQTVTLGNAGSAPLTFSYAIAAGNFIEGAGDTCSSAGGQLAPNTSCTILVVFKPSASGPLNSTLTITDNSNNVSGSQQMVALAGTGTSSSYTLNVANAGSGSGSVTSNPSGINCPSTCAANYSAGTQVILTASPGTGSIFTGWSGACTGMGTCTVAMNSNQDVTATFQITASTACNGTTTNWIGGASGNWSNALNWSTGIVPNGSSTNVCINNGSSIPSAVTLDLTASIGALYIDSGSSLNISNNTNLVVYGNISNAGQIFVSAAGNLTYLTIAASVSLTGGGTITLSKGGNGTAIIETAGGNQTFTNVDNTLEGTGTLGYNGLIVVNQAGGIINANAASNSNPPLVLNPSALTNQGLLEATSTGTLQIETVDNNAGGRILATGSGSSVQFISGTVQGGTLTSSNSGTLTTPGTAFTLDGSSQGTLTISGTFVDGNNSNLFLLGTINNTGTIQVAAAGNLTYLTIPGPVSLTGNGTVVLSTGGNGTAVVETAGGSQTLTNVNNTLQGFGTIGYNGLIIVNQASGVINANAANSPALLVNPNSLTNQGLLEATGGGTLNLQNTFYDAGGKISASGTNSAVQLLSGTIQGGTLTTASGGIITTPGGNTFTLDGQTLGTLNNAGTYVVSNNSNTILLGTINNTGQIQVNALGNSTYLTMSAAVSLTGAGTVTMTKNGNGTAILQTASGNQTFTNVNNTIQGTGVIGDGLILINQGTINANLPQQGILELNPDGLTNEGLLEATAGATLQLNGTTFNNTGGTILASGAGSNLQFANNAVIQSGTLSQSNGASLGVLSGNNLTLDGNAHGPLTITGTFTVNNNSTTFLTGTINNTGVMQVAAQGNNTFLTMSSGVTLVGNGVVTLSTGGNGTAYLSSAGGDQLLTNVDNTLQGFGVIGNGVLQVANQGTINANTSGTTLTLNTSGFTNQGLLEATSGGTLSLSASTINNQKGTITVNGATSSVQFASNTTIQGGTLSSLNNGVLTGLNVTLDGSTLGQLTNAGTYAVANNTNTTLLGTINNTGAIQINAAGNLTYLTIAGPVSLTGSGTVSLSTSGNGTAVIQTAGRDQLLTNVNNTLEGFGTIGYNGLQVTNQGTINANISPQTLTLNPSVFINQGLLEATSGGVLSLSGSTINNQHGNITVNGTASSVQFVSNATIQGGTISGINGGVLTGDGMTLDGATLGQLTILGTYAVTNNTNTSLLGTIDNAGTIQVNAAGNQTYLTIAGAVTLTGGGTVNLTKGGNGTAIIQTANGDQTLTNVNNLLEGTGTIGYNGLAVVNQGTINANLPAQGSLLLNPNGLTNAGLLGATAGATLQLNGTTFNNSNGNILATGTGSTVQFANGAVIQAGTITSAAGGSLNVLSGNTITFDGATRGQLTIAGTYTDTNNSNTQLTGTINNTGTIQVAAAGNLTYLTMISGVNLTGNGVVTLSTSGNGTAILQTAGGQQLLTNVNNTLQGFGTIGYNGLQVTNQGTINANISGATLTLNPSVFSNQGLLDASGGGILSLSGSTIANPSGTIQVNGSSSSVQFVSGATIQGGNVSGINGGVLTGNNMTLDGSTLGPLTVSGTYAVANNSNTSLLGTINNTGTIEVNAGGNNTFLTVTGPVSLTGTGSVILNKGGNGIAAIETANGLQTLTNVGNILQGTGVIGYNGLNLVNQGTIDANVPGGITLNPGVLTNQGVLEAGTGSTLQVSTTVANAGGTILANGSSSAVQFSNNLSVQGGTLSGVSGGIVGSTSGNFLTLDGTQNAVTIPSGGTYSVGNNSTTNIQGTINNNGTILLASTGNTTVLGDPTGNATLTGSGAVMMSSGTNLISGPALANVGDAIVDSSAFSLTSYTQSAGLLQVTPAGSALVSTFNLNGGISQVDGALSLSTGLNLSGNGTISGIGQITGNVSNSGIAQAGDIPNPGILTISGSGFGNYTQNSAGAYDVVIGGLKSGAQYSQLNVSSTATLAGTLNVSLVNGFVPVAGNQFTVLNAATLTGSFSTTNLPSLPPGLAWTVGYTANSVVLSVIQQVSTFTLTVTTLGTGDGSVTDNFGEINCVDTLGVQTGNCSAVYNAGTTVNLTATPVQPTVFGGWGGACSGTASCSVLMNQNQSVNTAFVPEPVTLPIPFSCPGGVYPCQNVTAPPAVFNCPSGGNPCMDPNAHSLTLNATQVNTAFTLTVAATEVPTTQANGDCENGQTPATDFDCRFTSFFPYETLGDGDIIVPACDAYSNGNCVFYSVYFGTRGTEPPVTDYDGPITWTIAWNNTSFPPPPNYPYQANSPQLYDDPDYEVSPTTPYGTNCNTPMLINGIPTNPPIYCQFVFDITDYFNPQQPPDAAIGGKTKQFNDVVVAFPLNNPVPSLSVTKTADQSQVKAGSPIGYTISLGNSSAPGTGEANNVVLSDPLPAGATVNWAISPAYIGPGTCTITGAPPSQTLSCSLGNLSPAITTSVQVSSATSSAGTYVNTATLSADNNPPQMSSATIQVTAAGPVASLNPTSLDFGDQKVGTTSKPQTANLTNLGMVPLILSSLNIDGDFAFAAGTTCTPNKRLSHGQSCTMKVTFTPKKTGQQNCRVLIEDNAAGGKQELMLSGTGD